MVYTNYFMILYRLVKMFGTYEDTIFKSKKNFKVFMSILYIGIMVIVMTPYTFQKMSSEEIYDETIEFGQSIAEFLSNETSTLGYSSKSAYRIQPYSIVISLTSVILIIEINKIIIHRFFERKMKGVRSDSTFKMMVRCS
jgi:hypothetical protein